MSRWDLVFILVLAVLFTALLGLWGLLIVAILAASIRKSKAPHYYPPIVEQHSTEQSIRSAWEKSDRTTVPEDMRTEYRLYLQSTEWKTLRQSVFKRDSHRCTQCGYIGYGLQAHHTHYDGIYTMAFTTDQLITVCKQCHDQIHRR